MKLSIKLQNPKCEHWLLLNKVCAARGFWNMERSLEFRKLSVFFNHFLKTAVTVLMTFDLSQWPSPHKYMKVPEKTLKIWKCYKMWQEVEGRANRTQSYWTDRAHTQWLFLKSFIFELTVFCAESRRCVGYLQVLHGDLHAGQVHVGNPGAGGRRPVAHREDVGERLPRHRLVGGDGGHGGPVTLMGDEAGDPGHLVVRRDPVPAGGGRAEGGPEAEEEHTHSPQNGAHHSVWRTVGERPEVNDR